MKRNAPALLPGILNRLSLAQLLVALLVPSIAAAQLSEDPCHVLGSPDASCEEVYTASDEVRPYEDYDARLRTAGEVAPLGEGVFGEQVSPYNGSTEFSVVDISLPGHSGLAVELRRRLVVESRRGPAPFVGFGVWELDVPYLSGVFDGGFKWDAGSLGGNDRCTRMWYPQTVSGLDIADIWSGVQFHRPGEGDSERLWRDSGHAVPGDGGTYPWTARGDIRFSCLSGTSNGYPGEGFVAVDPNGVRYFLDVGIERGHGMLKNSDGLSRARVRVYLVARRVEDRFGNAVDYTWSGNQLTRIQASDGRRIDIAWSGDRITSASAHGRTWTYGYSGTIGLPAVARLSQVTRPDGSAWSYGYTGTLLPV